MKTFILNVSHSVLVLPDIYGELSTRKQSIFSASFTRYVLLGNHKVSAAAAVVTFPWYFRKVFSHMDIDASSGLN